MRKRERGGGGRGREGEMGENWGRQAGERKGQLRTTEEGGKAKSTEEGGKTGNTEFGKSPNTPPPHKSKAFAEKDAENACIARKLTIEIHEYNQIKIFLWVSKISPN